MEIFYYIQDLILVMLIIFFLLRRGIFLYLLHLMLITPYARSCILFLCSPTHFSVDFGVLYCKSLAICRRSSIRAVVSSY